MSSTESSALLARALEALAADDVHDQSDGQARDRLLALLDALRLLQAEVVRQVDTFDTRGLSVTDGCRTTRSWLRGFGRLPEPAAGELIRNARVLRDLPELAGLHRDGTLTGDQLHHITRLVARIGIGPVTQAEPVLAAAAPALDATDFARVCQRILAHLDPDGQERDAAEAFTRRELVLSPCGGTMLIHGRLDPEGGAAVMTALDALTPAPADGDPTPARQRRADALVELAKGALTGGRLPAVGGTRPQVGLLVTPQQLIGRPTEAHPDHAHPDHAHPDQAQPTEAHATEVQPAEEQPGEEQPGEEQPAETPVPAETRAPAQAAPTRPAPAQPAPTRAAAFDPAAPWLDWFGDVATPIAQRIACDADIWRVLLDPATGRPTDLGRSRRLVPAWLRKALYARDRGCRFPGCRAPASWTDAHHLRHWAHGGPTNANNLILLCRFHHGLVHEGRWTITLNPDTGEVSAGRPDGTPYEIRDHRLGVLTDHAA